MDEDTLTFGFLIASVAVFMAGLVWQDFWIILFAMATSGSICYEAIGVMGFFLTFIGALVILYCALICVFWLSKYLFISRYLFTMYRL